MGKGTDMSGGGDRRRGDENGRCEGARSRVQGREGTGMGTEARR